MKKEIITLVLIITPCINHPSQIKDEYTSMCDDIPQCFDNFEYLKGFIHGYCFDRCTLITSKEYEELVLTRVGLDDKIIKFVKYNAEGLT